MNQIKTQPISILIYDKGKTPDRKEKVEHYLIPAYQRGYRWTEHHVYALLDDIDSFIQKQSQVGSTKEFYCLQPIVVVPQNDKEGKCVWEIVDGQQRLTTLYIILKRLGQKRYQIYFEKREKSTDFLKNLSKETLDDSNPDFHFMSEAYRCIDKWFDDKEAEDMSYLHLFITTLLTQVQVIWYEVALKSEEYKAQEAEKINIFNRLNIGKIPLEDAELIRALLMSKMDGETEHEKLMRQSEFSNQWYEIEQWLRISEVWNFLTSSKKISNHIQLIFELQAHNKNSENYSTYKWFEQEIKKAEDPTKKAKELWNETKNIFGKFRYWYSDRVLYHYVGFLLAMSATGKSKITLSKLLEESHATKDKFKNGLYQQIFDYLESVDLETLSYEEKTEDLKNILLLFNVLSVLQIKSNAQYRFPFNLYNTIDWSLEHIHAQQSEDPMKEEKAIRSWIEETLRATERIDTVEKMGEEVSISEIKSRLLEISQLDKNQINKDEFNDLKSKLIAIFESPSSKHLLENIALLSRSDNSGLNNAIFPVKRDRIIRKEREGSFIPLCTRNVFLKLYSKADNQPYFWSESDKKDYIAEINRIFTEFKNKRNDY